MPLTRYCGAVYVPCTILGVQECLIVTLPDLPFEHCTIRVLVSRPPVLLIYNSVNYRILPFSMPALIAHEYACTQSTTETEGPHPFYSRGRSLVTCRRVFHVFVISQSHENVILFHGAAQIVCVPARNPMFHNFSVAALGVCNAAVTSIAKNHGTLEHGSLVGSTHRSSFSCGRD